MLLQRTGFLDHWFLVSPPCFDVVLLSVVVGLEADPASAVLPAITMREATTAATIAMTTGITTGLTGMCA